MADLDRDEVLRLLGELESGDEPRILAAAAGLTSALREADKAWDDLLVSAPRSVAEVGEVVAEVDEIEDIDDHDDWSDGGEADEEFATSEQAQDAVGLVEKLLKDFKLTEETREDLEDFKKDIAENELAIADYTYIKGLHARLSKEK